VQLGGAAVVFVAAGPPMLSLHDCGGGDVALTGVQFAFLAGFPVSLAPFAFLAFVAWSALRRQPDAPDGALLDAALRYAAASFGGLATLLLPYLVVLFGGVTWFAAGFVGLGGWGVTALAAAVEAAWPIPAGGPDPLPRLRQASTLGRFGMLAAFLLLAGGFAAFWAGLPAEQGGWAGDYMMAAAGEALVVGLPLFFLMRAFEARLQAGRRLGATYVGVGLAAVGLLAGGNGVMIVVDQLDRREAAAQAAEAAREEAEQHEADAPAARGDAAPPP
jgi:hypothetical protein